MALHGDDNYERKLRPLYDALDARSYKVIAVGRRSTVDGAILRQAKCCRHPPPAAAARHCLLPPASLACAPCSLLSPHLPSYTYLTRSKPSSWLMRP